MLSALSAACDVFCKLQMPTKVEVGFLQFSGESIFMNFPWSFQDKIKNFHDLPLEVLHKIMKNLRWRE